MASESESGSEYEVVKILQQRRKKGVIEYLVRWSGFGPQEDSWEPEKRLGQCRKLINDFNYSNKSSAKKTTKRSRSRSVTRSSRSRSRSRSRGRKSPSRKKVETPEKKSTTSIRKSRSSTTGGTEERTTSVTKTIEEIKPQAEDDFKRTMVRETVKTVTTQSRSDTSRDKKSAWKLPSSDYLTTSDVPVLIIFACVTLIALSFVLEKYVNFEEIWNYICSLCGAASTWVKSLGSRAADSGSASSGGK